MSTGLIMAAAVLLSATVRAELPKVALELDGSDDYIKTTATAADLGIDGNKARTVEAWIMIRSFRHAGAVFSLGDNRTRNGEMSLVPHRRRRGNDEWRLWFSDRDRMGFRFPSSDDFLHIATVYTGEDVIVYVNGEDVARQERQLDTTDEGALSIGRRNHHQGRHRRRFDGKIAEVRVWNRALTQEEIQTRMTTPLEGRESGLTGYWPLNDRTGDTARDRSVAANHGVLHGEPEWRLARPFKKDLAETVAAEPGEPLTLGPVVLRNPAGDVNWKWYFEGDPVPGATESTLTIPDMTADHLGVYHAILNDDRVLTPVASSPVRIEAWPVWETDLAPIQGARPGDTVTLGPAERFDPRGTQHWQWFFEDEPIPGATEPELVLADISEEQFGMYHVQVNDDLDLTPVDSGRLRLTEPDWPTWRFDAQRSGRSPDDLADPLHLHWTLELPEPRRAWPKQLDDQNKLDFDISYEPVAARGLLYVPSMVTDSVTAYDLDRGEEQWRFYADGPVRLAPAFKDGRLYVASDDGHLYCLDAATGTELWRFAAVPSQRLVLGNERMISVWPVRGAPLVDDGTVYIAAGIWPFEGVFIYALNAESGAVQWVQSGAGYWQGDAYNRNDARSIANIAPQGYLTIDGDKLIVSGGRTTPGVYERATGRLLKFDTVHKRGGGYAVSALTDNYLLPPDTCEIYTGSQRQRSRDWSARVEGEVWRLLAADGRLIVVTRCGRIHVFGSEQRDPVVHAREVKERPRAEDAWQAGAAALLERMGEREGYALMFGIGSGRLLDELLRQSDLHVVAFDPDPDKVRDFRQRYAQAGLYGARVAVRQGDALSFRLPPYIASLMVSEDPTALGLGSDTPPEAVVRVLYRSLRPYGGVLWLPLTGAAQDVFAGAVQKADLEAPEVHRQDHALTLRRPGPLPGAGAWTHQYADAANSGYSDDDRVRPPFGLAWFGGPSNEHTLPRHMFGPRPQVAGGRLVILGVNQLSARCVYTGREVWSQELPDVGDFFTSASHERRFVPGRLVYFPSHHGANFVGSPYITTPDSVYIIHNDRCLRFDLATGEKLAEFVMPDRETLQARVGASAPSYGARVTTEQDRQWGHIAVSGDALIVAAYPHVFGERPTTSSSHLRPQRGEPGHWNATSSEYLLVMHRETGDLQWVRQARHGFRHNAIAAGSDRVFAIDNISEEVTNWLQRRGIEPEADAAIHALDIHTGRELWTYDKNVFGTWLSFSGAHDALIQSGRPGGRSVLPDEPTGDIVVLRGTDGKELWRREASFSAPLAIHKTQARLFPVSLDIATGAPVARVNPVTGGNEDWRFLKQKSCGSFNLSRHLLTYRSSMAAYHDLMRDSGTAYVAGVKAGCTDNLIVADGMLNVPDYTRSCSCAYQLQTSAGLVHMPEVEHWTAHNIGDPGRTGMARIGLNLGAPGDRVDENGTLWSHVPRQAPSLRLNVDLTTDDDAPNEGFVGQHSLLIAGGDGPAWVAASANTALRSLRLRDVRGRDARYRVVLYFAELENAQPGERRFDIQIDETLVHKDFDVVRAAGGPMKATTLVFDDIGIDAHFNLTLVQAEGSTRPPTLSGLELVRLD